MEIIELVIDRLGTLGFFVEESNKESLEYLIQKNKKSILNTIHNSVVPEGLTEVLVERVCGDFIESVDFSKISEQSKEEILENCLKSVKLGDSEVSYEVSAQEGFYDRIRNFIFSLRSFGEEEILCYRKLRW